MTAAGTHVLGTRDAAYGQVWHLPNPETCTTRHITDVYAAARQRRTDCNVRGLLHTSNQFAAPFVVDDSVFRDAFAGHTTDWADIVASTVDRYRAHAAQHELSIGLAEATTLEVAA